jgi:hypothetical protein
LKAVAAQQRCATLQAVVAGRQRRVAPTSGRASDGWQWTHAASGEGGVDARRARGGRERKKADARDAAPLRLVHHARARHDVVVGAGVLVRGDQEGVGLAHVDVQVGVVLLRGVGPLRFHQHHGVALDPEV